MVWPAAARCRVEQHVGRLHVPVHQAVGVRGVQRGRYLGNDADHPGRRQRALLVDQRPDIPALHVAHRDKQHPGGLAGLEDRDDMRVIDGRSRSRLPDEPLPECLVAGKLGGQDLKRYPPVKPGIVRAEDNGHPAPADLLLKPVARDLRAHGEPAWCRGDLVTHRASSGSPARPVPARAALRRSDARRREHPGSAADRRVVPVSASPAVGCQPAPLAPAFRRRLV